ncbi:methionine--tRNA ligase [Desulfovibrio litoralis]|uniref:Methionine--tRNA ligase n=1 Tax=Desulfovibrio litoralis DSM 11393 TaxID=1121455 RepID=A0A1M7SNJ8_9BACT|nr:methionine--tRNA ligase [Desulfovibrio litoralis]SHN60040.1 methionyl-tRNA synthetase [Desulfovibrio litoralis DSM 11393]
MKNFYLSTPIYYVNAKPHLGHAYTSILADSLCRFHQLKGEKTFLVTGSDEHGDKIVKAAEKEKLDVKTFTDNISQAFKDILPKLGVNNSAFVRTSSEKHKKCVQEFLQKVYDKGDIYFGEYGGHYCYGCERFYTEKELLADGTCPQHLVKPEYISEKNYFFKMSKYQDWLVKHIEENPDFIRPERYRNEVLSMLNSGDLEDLCISRPKSRLSWGIELPFDNNYVCYVWFDALLSYISALGGEKGQAFNEFWNNAEHLVAKDILKPHAIFWACMLKSAELPIYKHLNVHGYWLVRDTKMSKSLGNVVAPLDMIDKYGLATFRYFLLREMHFGSDASFSIEALVSRRNADLANDLGNLFSRVLAMNAKYFGSVLPQKVVDGELELELASLAKNSFQNFQTMFENLRFSNALEALWELVRALNKYIDSAAPWVLHKAQEIPRLGTVIYTLLEYMRKISLHLWAVMPETAEEMLSLLGVKFDINQVNLEAEIESFGSLQVGSHLAANCNLFPRIDVVKPDNSIGSIGSTGSTGSTGKTKANKEKKVANVQSETLKSTESYLDFSDFQKLDLRIGTILEAEQHPNADKLLCFKIDVGEESTRQIVSGIAEFFNPKDLVGKQVVVLTNLPPRKLRGVESQGMILTAAYSNNENKEVLSLLTAMEHIKSGAKIS